MKFTLPLFLSGVLSVGMSAYADSLETLDGIASGISPDASQVVGIKSQWGDSMYTSFLYTVADGDTQWLTDGDNYFGSHLDGGRFTAVNNAGIIAGGVRNPDMRLSNEVGPYYNPPKNYAPPKRNFSDDEEGQAITSAAVWRNGKLYMLGCGPYTIDFFYDSTDGSLATGISEDGNIVFGNIVSSWMPIEACIWVYDEASDSYVYNTLARPADAMISSMIANSATGFPAIGAVSLSLNGESFMTTALWLSADEFVNIEMPDLSGANAVYAHSISADGRYVTISVAGTHPKLYLYDVENATLEEAELPAGTTTVTGYTVTNEGNAILKIQDSDWQSTLYYYDHQSGTMVTLAEYLNDTMPSFNFSNSLSYAKAIATTGDGKHLLIQEDSYSAETWLLTIDNPRLLAAPAPASVDLYHTSPATLEVKFEGIASLPEECELKGYKVYVDNNEVKEIEVTETGSVYYVEADGIAGSRHTAYVCTLYTKNGETKLSSKSTVASAYVSSDCSLIGFYDFDDSSIDSEGNITWSQDTWQPSTNYGVSGQFINWHLTSSDFENRTPAVAVVTVATEPWSSLFTSHYMDATDNTDFYIDFRYQMRLVNSATQNLTSDFLDIEASADGRNWTTIASVRASETSPYVWHTLHVDLGDKLAGQMFQLRLNAHGEGVGQLMWLVDDIAIGDELAGEQPTGLRYDANDESVKVMWHNSLGLYDLSYLDNSAILWDYNVGNEGKPLMSAIELTQEQIKPFIGEYINAVSTFLYDDPSILQDAPTNAEAIIYADGEEVARANFDAEFNTVSQAVAWLNTPILIESGKTYRVAVRISDYAVEQAPMYYQAASTSVTGLSDLYSEDEGRTWQNASSIIMSDVNPEGLCSWPIRAHISSEQVSDNEPSDVLFFDIFRDGEKINNGNVYEPHAWFTIPAPFDGLYTVQAHYKGGVISPMSEVLDLNGVNGIKQVHFTLGVTTGQGTVTINGDCLGAILYDMAGRVVASTDKNTLSGIPAGVYVLKAQAKSGSETYKVVVK